MCFILSYTAFSYNIIFIYRGETFRQVFRQLGDIRAIVPSRINIMALTATATEATRREVCRVLGMSNPVVVETSPDKPHVFLRCSEFTSIVDVFLPITEQLKVDRVNMGRLIIFCIALCSQVYSFFKYIMGPAFTEPPNYPISQPQYRLVDMFTSGTHPTKNSEIV